MRLLECMGALVLILTLSTGLQAQLLTAPESTDYTEPGQVSLYYPLIPFDSGLDPQVAARVEEQLHLAALDLLTQTLPYGSPLGSYEVHLETERLLSLSLTVSGYRPPAAHPMTYARSLTFDLHTGQLLTLADLFRGEYLSALSSHITAQIEQATEDELPLLRPFEGIDPEADFYLTPDGLVVYFQLYDLLPYAWGFPQFPIAYGELSDVLDDAYRFLADGASSKNAPGEALSSLP